MLDVGKITKCVWKGGDICQREGERERCANHTNEQVSSGVGVVLRTYINVYTIHSTGLANTYNRRDLLN